MVSPHLKNIGSAVRFCFWPQMFDLKKVIKARKKYSVHDEENKFKNGDKVSIRECKPYSKSKKFEVIGDVKWYKFKQNYL